MTRFITPLTIAPVKLEPAAGQSGQTLTLIALGNLIKIDGEIKIWCLFCDAQKILHESLQHLALMPYFRLGCQFQNGCLINSHSVQSKYQCILSSSKTEVGTIPERLIPADFSGLNGQYQHQQFIKVRNKQIQLADVLLRILCPDPGFSKISLSLLSQSFIFRHVMAEGDHLYAELENIYKFRLSRVVAKQLALLAGCEEYRAWQRSIAIYAGEALASKDGGPWHCPLPEFKVKVNYSPVGSPGAAPVYLVASATPQLSVPFRQLTLYTNGKSRTIQL